TLSLRMQSAMQGKNLPVESSIEGRIVTASVLPAALAALDPAGWVYLLSWGLPLAGVALGSLVARRWSWPIIVLSGVVVGVIGSVLLAVSAAADLSPAEAVSI